MAYACHCLLQTLLKHPADGKASAPLPTPTPSSQPAAPLMDLFAVTLTCETLRHKPVLLPLPLASLHALSKAALLAVPRALKLAPCPAASSSGVCVSRGQDSSRCTRVALLGSPAAVYAHAPPYGQVV